MAGAAATQPARVWDGVPEMSRTFPPTTFLAFLPPTFPLAPGYIYLILVFVVTQPLTSFFISHSLPLLKAQ